MKVLASLVFHLGFWSSSWQNHAPTPNFPLAILINLDLLRSELGKKTLLDVSMDYDDLRNFLYERCQKVVQRMVRELPTHLCQYDSDYLLNIAYGLIENPDYFFRNFNFDQVNSEYFYPTYIKYTEQKIKCGIYEKLRQQTGLETIGRSNLGLASRASKKKVQIALDYQGYDEAFFSQNLQIWACFQEFRKSTNNLPVNRYQNHEFQEIADLYYKRSYQSVSQNLDGEEIQKILNAIGAAIRRLLDDQYPYVSGSLDNPDNANWLEDRQTNSVAQDFFSLEENGFLIEYSNMLKESLNDLLPTIPQSEDRRLLFCRHGLKLKQREIAPEFNEKQYQISRRLARVYQHLWFQVIDWAEQNMNQEFPINSISAESRECMGSESLEYLTNLLDECYENQLNQLLNQCYQNSSYSPSMLDCMIPKIKEKFDIILSQYLTEKLIGLRLN